MHSSQLPRALGATSPGSHSPTGELHPLQTHCPEPKGGPSLAGRGPAVGLSLSPTFAQVTAGGGTPVALHRRVTAAPSVAVTRTGPGSMLGGTGKEEEPLILHGQGHVRHREQGTESTCPTSLLRGTPSSLSLTVDDQGHVLPVRAEGVGHLTGERPCIPLRRLLHVQAPVSPDGIAVTWGHLGTGREQKAGQMGGSNNNISVSLGHIQK